MLKQFPITQHKPSILLSSIQFSCNPFQYNSLYNILLGIRIYRSIHNSVPLKLTRIHIQNIPFHYCKWSTQEYPQWSKATSLMVRFQSHWLWRDIVVYKWLGSRFWILHLHHHSISLYSSIPRPRFIMLSSCLIQRKQILSELYPHNAQALRFQFQPMNCRKFWNIAHQISMLQRSIRTFIPYGYSNVICLYKITANSCPIR